MKNKSSVSVLIFALALLDFILFSYISYGCEVGRGTSSCTASTPTCDYQCDNAAECSFTNRAGSGNKCCWIVGDEHGGITNYCGYSCGLFGCGCSNWNGNSWFSNSYGRCNADMGSVVPSSYNGKPCDMHWWNGGFLQDCEGSITDLVYDSKDGRCVRCGGDSNKMSIATYSGTSDYCPVGTTAYLCENACDSSVPSDLDGVFPIGWHKDVSISGSSVSGGCGSAKVAKGKSITFSFKFAGTGAGYPYEVRSLYDVTGGGELRLNCYYGTDSGACNWNSDSFTVTAPSILGSYVYQVRTRESSRIDDYNCQPGYSTRVWTNCGFQVVDCIQDSDCSSQNNIKGQCISNVCQWPPCDADSDCTSGLCYCGGSACYSSFTSASCSAGYCCNRGYGGSGIGSCVYQGTTYNNIYLCDP
jgi:hypothetical protein